MVCVCVCVHEVTKFSSSQILYHYIHFYYIYTLYTHTLFLSFCICSITQIMICSKAGSYTFVCNHTYLLICTQQTLTDSPLHSLRSYYILIHTFTKSNAFEFMYVCACGEVIMVKKMSTCVIIERQRKRR